MCGGEKESALPAAMAVELLHNFTLIHDDIMDSAETRRNQPSVVKKWDANTAILSGDVLFAHAAQQLEYYGTDDRYTKEQYLEINKSFFDAVIKVCKGQAMDMEFESKPMVDLDEYLDMIDAKTAALFSCSLKLGALAAQDSKEQVEFASELGYHAGIAFQIQDDLLDAIGEENIIGKKIGGDILEGKKTWLTISAYSKGSDSQKQILTAILQKEDTTRDDVDKIINLYRYLDVISDAEKTINYHYKKAQSCLDKFDDSKYKNEINNLLHQLMIRES